MDYRHIEVSKQAGVYIVRFLDARILNDAVIERIGRELYDLAAREDCANLLLSFAGVDSLSSSVFGKVITLNKRMRVKGGVLKLCEMKPEILELFTRTTPSYVHHDTSSRRATMHFDHVGFVTTEEKPGAVFVPATKVWVTNHEDHPYHVEWLRFEADSPVTGPLRDGPHIGYRVDSVEAITEAAEGLEVVLEPFDAGFAVAGFYKTPDGAMVEFVTYKDGPSPWI